MVNTYNDQRYPDTHEDQGGIEVLVVFLHVFGIVFHRLSFVHGVEIELGVVALDGLEVHPQGLLDAVSDEFSWSLYILTLLKRTTEGRR